MQAEQVPVFNGTIHSMRSHVERTEAWRQLICACALIFGLIGMHHLIAAGCLTASPSHSDPQMTQSHMGTTVSEVNLIDTEFASDNSAHIGATCMAILMIFSVIIPHLRALTNRERINSAHSSSGSQRTTDPPKIILQSILRM